MSEKNEQNVSRYAAKLLFQYRINGIKAEMRLTQERIFLVRTETAKEALLKAKERGRDSEFSFVNSDKNEVFYEFIGVMDLLSLEPECEEDEVWYDVKKMKLPMERKERLIPDESELDAMREEEPPTIPQPQQGFAR